MLGFDNFYHCTCGMLYILQYDTKAQLSTELQIYLLLKNNIQIQYSLYHLCLLLSTKLLVNNHTRTRLLLENSVALHPNKITKKQLTTQNPKVLDENLKPRNMLLFSNFQKLFCGMQHNLLTFLPKCIQY